MKPQIILGNNMLIPFLHGKFVRNPPKGYFTRSRSCSNAYLPPPPFESQAGENLEGVLISNYGKASNPGFHLFLLPETELFLIMYFVPSTLNHPK